MYKSRLLVVTAVSSALLLGPIATAGASIPTTDNTSAESSDAGVVSLSPSEEVKVESIGDYLESQLQGVEDDTWNSSKSKKIQSQTFSTAKSSLLSPRSAKQLNSLSQDQLGVEPETLELVNVNSSEVVVEGSEVISRNSNETKVEYSVRFTRDVEELSDAEDWTEIIPYELTISNDGKIQNIVVKDDEYVVAQFQAEALTSEDEPEIDPLEPGSEDESGSTTALLPAGVAEPAIAFPAGMSTTNKKKVVSYALKWGNSYNPNYKTYDTDCTNFASQALAAGGWKQISG